MTEKKLKGQGLMLLPPAPGKCQECAVEHKPEEPHDGRSLFYHMYFLMTQGREPTWEDALAHCDDKMHEAWRKGLAVHGVVVKKRKKVRKDVSRKEDLRQ